MTSFIQKESNPVPLHGDFFVSYFAWSLEIGPDFKTHQLSPNFKKKCCSFKRIHKKLYISSNILSIATISDTEDDESEEEDTRDEYQKAMDKAEDYMQEKQGRALMEMYPDLISKLQPVSTKKPQKSKGDNTEKAESKTRGDSRMTGLDLDAVAKALEIRRSDLGKMVGKMIKKSPK